MIEQVTDELVEEVLAHYIIAALWSSTDNTDDSGGEPLDRNYDRTDIDSLAEAEMRAQVDSFLRTNLELIKQLPEEFGPEQIGHDFWLTRNGHGVGFWDRDLGELGDQLTEACDLAGEQDIYVGDDGKLYVS